MIINLHTHEMDMHQKIRKSVSDSGSEELDTPFKEIYDKFNQDSFEDLFQKVSKLIQKGESIPKIEKFSFQTKTLLSFLTK